VANNVILAPTQTAQTTTDITVAAGASLTVGLYTDYPTGAIPSVLPIWLMLDNPGAVDEKVMDMAKQQGYATVVSTGGVYRVIIPDGLSKWGVNVGVFTYS
jgi:hypothetical protein